MLTAGSDIDGDTFELSTSCMFKGSEVNPGCGEVIKLK